MTEPKWTKAPLFAVGRDIYEHLDDGDRSCVGSADNSPYDATLWAAAPDLYDAACGALAYIETAEWGMKQSETVRRLQAALAKARGES